MKDKVLATMSVSAKTLLVIASIFFGAIVFVYVSLFLTWGPSCSLGWPPSDDEMIRFFADNRLKFEELLDGYTEEDLKNLGTSPEWEGAYSFIVFSEGWLGGSHQKGYRYSKEPPPSRERRDEGSVGRRSRHIEGHWYIWEYLDP